jgi:hypothetical protein
VPFAAIPAAVLVAFTSFASLTACRGLLDIDENASSDTDAADAGEAGAEGGPSRFTIVNALPAGPALNAIKGWDANHWIAVGNDDVSYIYQNGELTRLGGGTPGRDLNGVWGRSPKDVYAVGAVGIQGVIDHFDGTAWTLVFTAPTQLFAVWGMPDGTVLATGEKGIMYGVKTGSTWQKVQTVAPNPDLMTTEGPDMWGLSGRSFDDFTIAGDLNYFLHTEQKELVYYEPVGEEIRFHSVFQLPGPQTNVVFGTSYSGMYWFTAPSVRTTDASIIPAGSGYALSRLFRDEKSPGAASKFMYGVWASADKAVGVGSDGRIVVVDLGLAESTQLKSPTDDSLGSVWGSSDDDVWIVGNREIILHGSVR